MGVHKEEKVAIFRLSGVHVKHCKNTAKMSAVRIPVPKTVNVPMSMHIGAPARPVVKVGDEVTVSEGLFEGYTGTVEAISDDLKKITVLIKRGRRDMPVELDASVVKLA